MTQRNRIAPPCPGRVNVLLVGGGGREHALAWKLAQSSRLNRLWITNADNPALAALGEPCPVPVDPKEFWRLAKWCDRNQIDLIVVGPEAPLAAGIADELATERRLVFGPSRAAARLEFDKAWAKALMRSASIPTAEARSFSNFEKAKQYLQAREEAREELPVIKASGLAAGKGVVLPRNREEAIDALTKMMRQRIFGDAGAEVVIEERLSGPEVSVLALIDGRNIYLLEPCQDHKRVGEGDTGPNTGGMGAYCPTPLVDAPLMRTIEHDILVPTLDALRREEIDFRGVLYAGLILTPAGPKVLEFNCRFGDPECQPLMMRFRGDLVETLWATAAGRLDQIEFDWDPRPACCIIMASKGYPGKYETGKPIKRLDEAQQDPDVVVFHAGTRQVDGELVTAGGRVLSVTALGHTIAEARDRALRACDLIDFPGKSYRRDIAWQAIERPVGRD